jgi:hypothetical protein
MRKHICLSYCKPHAGHIPGNEGRTQTVTYKRYKTGRKQVCPQSQAVECVEFSTLQL